MPRAPCHNKARSAAMVSPKGPCSLIPPVYHPPPPIDLGEIPDQREHHPVGVNRIRRQDPARSRGKPGRGPPPARPVPGPGPHSPGRLPDAHAAGTPYAYHPRHLRSQCPLHRLTGRRQKVRLQPRPGGTFHVWTGRGAGHIGLGRRGQRHEGGRNSPSLDSTTTRLW